MNINNFFVKIVISLLSIGIFWALESGFSLRNGDEFVKSVIFAVVLFISFTKKLRKYLLTISIMLFVAMVILYLFWQIPSATLFGSLGVGILFIYIFSFISDLIKKGFVE